MKTLQNNFTTPEQSKRLLELGVPEDSADCYYHHYFTNDPTPLLRVLQLQWDETIGAIRGKSGQKIDPCWSVGRLIELLVTCAIDKDYVKCIIEDIAKYAAPVETYVNVITYLCEKKELDFSKLEVYGTRN